MESKNTYHLHLIPWSTLTQFAPNLICSRSNTEKIKSQKNLQEFWGIVVTDR